VNLELAELFKHPLKDRVASFAPHAVRFLGANLVEGLVHLATMWKRSRICGLRAFFANDLQIGLPHIRADEHDLGNDFFAYGSEEPLKGFDGSFFARPKQAGNIEIRIQKERPHA